MDLSLLAVFGAGVLTFLSPCILPLAPILVASLVVGGGQGRWPRLRSTLWFTLGFAIVFVLTGLSLPVVSSHLGDHRPYLLAAGGVLLAVFGLKMIGAIKPTAGLFRAGCRAWPSARSSASAGPRAWDRSWAVC